jgi:hypothetical protein
MAIQICNKEYNNQLITEKYWMYIVDTYYVSINVVKCEGVALWTKFKAKATGLPQHNRFQDQILN